ncbi:ABC transporter ATP-binding protein [Bauldia litoralis]|uniref:Nucleoside ABC transporter ATP-binding protein n=1 Tax=Bauldia litoralis TaxID=665467 RepID=A0A1G6EG21_9HYPH|nr:ABC transporter ATP-binding protein [Bauldia litoralis]SDB56342.1 nucleoside ABC transporter ATP-binding protein [Bauldia litoralis]
MDIELRGITKRFGPVVANSDVNLTIRSGEIFGLLGENGAGKSTLMNVLSGLYRPDEGEILIDGKPVRFEGAGDAIRAGIGMVHQHFMLVPVFTVAENVVLGVEPTGRLDHLDLKTARRQVREIGAQHGLVVDPDAIIEEVPVGIQQRVEIIKVLFRSADVLIFDEPTAVLTPQEVEDFFGIVRSLRDAGKALVFITHKLFEILEVADRISVLRGGKIVGEGDPKTATEADLAEMMVGRPVSFTVDKAPKAPGPALLEISDLKVLNDRHEVAVDNVSLNVRAGEIVGIAGVQGNGQTELVEALTGLRPTVGGAITFLGEDVTRASTRDLHARGIAHVPEDRQRDGLIEDFTIAENMVLDSYYDDRFSTGLNMHWQKVHEETARIVTEFDVRTSSVFDLAGHLSGGNQQKLVVARELSREIKLLIASQPTRGVDVGSIEYIHERIVAARDAGVGVIVVSTELDEIRGLSDRILVMFRGRVVAEFDSASATVAQLGLAMAGAAA